MDQRVHGSNRTHKRSLTQMKNKKNLKKISKMLFEISLAYKRALIQTYPSILREYEKIIDGENCEQDMKLLLSLLGLSVESKDIKDAYIKNLIKLDSEILNEIIDAFKTKSISQEQVVVDAVANELLERSINLKI
jgi:hypothetical protein